MPICWEIVNSTAEAFQAVFGISGLERLTRMSIHLSIFLKTRHRESIVHYSEEDQ
jgi:hypothetical protein